MGTDLHITLVKHLYLLNMQTVKLFVKALLLLLLLNFGRRLFNIRNNHPAILARFRVGGDE